MQPVIYIDVLIAINVIVTYLLLLASSQILNVSATPAGLLSGSFLGGVYSLLILAPAMGPVLPFIIKLLLSLSIVSAGFKPRSVRFLFKTLMVFFGVNCAFAGAALLVVLPFRPNGVLYNNGSVYMNFSFFSLVGTAVVCYISVTVINRLTKRRLPGGLVYDVTVSVMGGELKGRGLLDTGNTMTDGFAGNPVVIAEESFVAPLLPPNVIDFMHAKFDEDYTLPEKWIGRVRMLPAVSVSGTKIMPAIKSDYLVISDKNNENKICNVMIALANEKISDEYSFLLNGELGFEGLGVRD
ncbi:MAG: sigma-E processing peptidase SpoIIGA [Oscillospiraceae bacterium]|nr:sigma-E processing peptidase SpoIIGA [Oscillospiraceae bacterium]